MDKKNLALLNDFYEYTMASGFTAAGLSDRIAYFDIFFREVGSRSWASRSGWTISEADIRR